MKIFTRIYAARCKIWDFNNESWNWKTTLRPLSSQKQIVLQINHVSIPYNMKNLTYFQAIRFDLQTCAYCMFSDNTQICQFAESETFWLKTSSSCNGRGARNRPDLKNDVSHSGYQFWEISKNCWSSDMCLLHVLGQNSNLPVCRKRQIFTENELIMQRQRRAQ